MASTPPSFGMAQGVHPQGSARDAATAMHAPATFTVQGANGTGRWSLAQGVGGRPATAYLGDGTRGVRGSSPSIGGHAFGASAVYPDNTPAARRRLEDIFTDAITVQGTGIAATPFTGEASIFVNSSGQAPETSVPVPLIIPQVSVAELAGPSLTELVS